MLATALVRTVGREHLHLRFRAGRKYVVEIVERPGVFCL